MTTSSPVDNELANHAKRGLEPACRQTGATVVAAEMAHAGVNTLFGVMGDGNADLIAAAVARHGLRYISARHEQGAVSMAEGFAHATGKPGVATVTYGPGATNTLTAVTTAARHRARVLLVGGHRTGQEGPPQFHDPDALFAPSGAQVLRIDRADEISGSVQRALDIVAAANGPVVLSLADTLLESPAPERAAPPAEQPAPIPPKPADISNPGTATLHAIADLLTGAERPLILAGRGARDISAEIVALGERCGAAMMTTLMGHGLYGDHPQALGISGGLARPEGQEALRTADAVLVLGAGLNGWTLAAGDAFANAQVVQVDSDPAAFSRAFRPADVMLLADAGATCRALLPLLSDRSGNRLWWQEFPLSPNTLPMMASTKLDPDALARALDGALPKDRALALDGGHFFEALCREIRLAGPRAFFWTLGFGAVGLGLATGIGAAVGRPDRLTVVGIGDGGLLMSLPELETLARLRLPVLVLVMNDASYGAEEKLLTAQGWPPELARFPVTDFAAVGRAMGIESSTLRTEADVNTILPRLRNLEAPMLLDARIDQSRDAGFVSLLHRLKAASG